MKIILARNDLACKICGGKILRGSECAAHKGGRAHVQCRQEFLGMLDAEGTGGAINRRSHGGRAVRSTRGLGH